MRLLLVGAFAYPHHQGSQVYFQEQAIALRAAGADVSLLTYASQGPLGQDANRWRAVDGFLHLRGPAWSAPRSIAAGPNLGKPLADLGLAMTLNDAIASKNASGEPYDAILTHNIEACVISLLVGMTQKTQMPPVIYCVHTLMQFELSAYFNTLKNNDFSDSKASRTGFRERVKRVIDRFGQALDRWTGRRANAWIALTHSSARVMRSYSRGPGDLIPPPIPDPLRRSLLLDPAGTANKHGLKPGDYILYSGNLDAYQEIELLGDAARRLQGRILPIVVASHNPGVLTPGALPAGLQAHWVESDAEMQGLIAAARATIVMRRAEGGFPIKLANSLACGTPPIAFWGREWGLTDGIDARLADPSRPGESLAEAVADLSLGDPERARRLRDGARQRWERDHRPAVVADRTLLLVERLLGSNATQGLARFRIQGQSDGERGPGRQSPP